MIVILIFLLSIRSTLVTAISIPVSVLITFIGMLAAGYSLNIITLGALTIAIGRVVDDSIVVIENIKRHLGLGEDKLDGHQDRRARGRGRGHGIDHHDGRRVPAARPRRRHHGRAVPAVRAHGRRSRCSSSLFVSLTIVPVLAYWFLEGQDRARRTMSRPRRPTRPRSTSSTTRRAAEGLPAGHPLDRREAPADHDPRGRARAARRPLALVPLGLKTNFIGNSGQNTLTVTQTLPLGTSLEAQDEAAKEVESAAAGHRRRRDRAAVDRIGRQLARARSSAAAGRPPSRSRPTRMPTRTRCRPTCATTIEALDRVGRRRRRVAAAAVAASPRATSRSTSPRPSDADLARRRRRHPRRGEGPRRRRAGDEQPRRRRSRTSRSQVDRDKAAAAGLSEIAVGGIVTEAMNPSRSARS